jgi:DNA-binding MarR family transcriptional regulator
MRIDEEIKGKFRNEFHKVALNIFFTSNWLSQHQKEIFKNFKITVQQYNILRILRGQKGQPVTIGNIKSRMLERESDVSRIVDKMKQRGWIKRYSCEEDRRATHIFITEAGMQLLKDMDCHEADFDKMLSGLSKEDAEQLNNLLDKIREYKP